MAGTQLTRAIEKTDELLVVDFWATWCGPCKQFAPTFKQVASQLEPKARFIKIETEKEQAISAKYNIRSIPTLAIFKNGKEIDRVSGALSVSDFSNWVNQHT
jgi:thioredoxin 2